jgi:hypothetical protein
VTQDDLLYRFRLRTFAMAAELGNVRAACRAMGIHPSTYYRWKRQLTAMVRRSCGAGAKGAADGQCHQPLGGAAGGRLRAGPSRLWAGRIAAELARPRWGGIVLSTNGCGGCCAATASAPAPSVMGWWPATRLRLSPSGPRAARAAPGRRASRPAGPARLRLYRPAERHQGHRVAVHRHRRRLGVCLGDPTGDPP